MEFIRARVADKAMLITEPMYFHPMDSKMKGEDS